MTMLRKILEIRINEFEKIQQKYFKEVANGSNLRENFCNLLRDPNRSAKAQEDSTNCKKCILSNGRIQCVGFRCE